VLYLVWKANCHHLTLTSPYYHFPTSRIPPNYLNTKSLRVILSMR
jgi:hypothetical protein